MLTQESSMNVRSANIRHKYEILLCSWCVHCGWNFSDIGHEVLLNESNESGCFQLVNIWFWSRWRVLHVHNCMLDTWPGHSSGDVGTKGNQRDPQMRPYPELSYVFSKSDATLDTSAACHLILALHVTWGGSSDLVYHITHWMLNVIELMEILAILIAINHKCHVVMSTCRQLWRDIVNDIH